MGYQDFYELDVWKIARTFKKAASALALRFPDSEQFELRNQLLRAARSIQANIAEGHGRQSSRDEARFLAIARGSLAETLNHLIEAFDMGFISAEELRGLKDLYDQTGRALNGYMRYVKSKIPLPRSRNEPDSGIVGEEDVSYEGEDLVSTVDLLQSLKSEHDEQSAG